MKYHGHSLYYLATVLAIASGSSKYIVAMAIVVMGDTCAQSITAIRSYYYQATTLVIVINCLWLFVIVILLLPWRW